MVKSNFQSFETESFIQDTFDFSFCQESVYNEYKKAHSMSDTRFCGDEFV